ncbi:hypothetical protein CEXT_793581 [Caerostris extrusa]|uniref:Uncharacterized protein n=1 Tax=Caerostris extrusa TaxID=172846 RepID=A0AAV4NEB9_CAEEX|nr:hypothetical protein CEXT_793581 [Caerostris extrusa]
MNLMDDDLPFLRPFTPPHPFWNGGVFSGRGGVEDCLLGVSRERISYDLTRIHKLSVHCSNRWTKMTNIILPFLMSMILGRTIDLTSYTISGVNVYDDADYDEI